MSIGNLRTWGQANSSLTDKLLNAIPTFFSSLVFFLFYRFWKKTSTDYTSDVRNKVKLLSYKAV